jgi:phosphoesterase RecJ-like protein
MDDSLARALRFLEDHSAFLVVGHTEPDGDCVAAQLTLVRWLHRRGKRAAALSEGPFDRPEIASFAGEFVQRPGETMPAADAVVVIDCSALERTGVVSEFATGLPSLVVDHHASGSSFGDVRLVDPESPATTLLVFDIISAAGDRLAAEDADLLLLGFCTDTGFFRHLDPGSAPALRKVAGLLESGASPRRVYRAINSGRSLGQARLLGRMLDRVESHLDGRVLVTWQTLEDQHAAGAAARGSAELYTLLQMVAGSEIVVMVKEEAEDRCSVGLRSSGAFDVGRLAQSLGGGGHKPAAGYVAEGTIEHVTSCLLVRISNEIAQSEL